MTNPIIFILEDDNEVAEVMRRALEAHGFAVERFSRRVELGRRLAAKRPALCLIDLGLPDGDGLSVIGSILRDLDIPTIIVTGRGDLADRVIGLELGADDYIVKPLEPRELVARIRSVLRRSGKVVQPKGNPGQRVARFSGWRADFDAFVLTTPEGEAQQLSAAEADLLRAFCAGPGRVLSRSVLLDLKTHDSADPYDRSIDVRISRLRRKLRDDTKNPTVIRTVYGAGYVFTPQVEWE